MSKPTMSSPLYTEDELKRLSWQCRRGIKEVEVLLAPFFAKHFLSLSEQDQKLFVTLLDKQDVEMFEWFTQRAEPSDPDMKHIVNVILTRLAS
ncbi:MAG: succinate dehydrogenase assembly factor 2 [Pseudomonadales bacterium]|nr:succinate dehydrogenase assembly factor 2 [Pseudomonadales bacterium]